ncbi:MAG: hypothetical protein JSW25_01745, partial [Thermoplasmata archaeon]
GLVEGDVDALLAHAHAAEVMFKTGLGDVVAQARGGIDVRWLPGLPPFGRVESSRQEAEVLLAWGASPLHTRSVLTDEGARRRLEAACVPRLEGLEGEPDLAWLTEQGLAFAREAGLMSPDVETMIGLCSAHGSVSQVMLGNSVFATGDLKAMGRELEAEGFKWVVTSVDNLGVRTLD